MGVVIPAGFALVQHFFVGPGVPLGAATTYGCTHLGDITPAEMAELLHVNWANAWDDFASSSTALSTTRVKFGPNATGPFAEHQAIRSGGAASEQQPPSISLLVDKTTALGGRRGSGRMFVPGVTEAAVGPGGILVAASQANWQASMTAIYDGIGDMTEVGSMVLLHGPGETAIPAPTLVLGLQVQGKVALQARRYRG